MSRSEPDRPGLTRELGGPADVTHRPETLGGAAKTSLDGGLRLAAAAATAGASA